MTRRYPWFFVAFGVVLVGGIVLFLMGERGRGAFFAVMGAVGLWQAWIVSGGGRMRPSPRLVAAAKHMPLVILLFVGSIWIVATGIAHVARGQSGEGWLRIALALVLAVTFLFALQRALRDYG